MKLNRFEYFVAVADELSFSRAAEKLHISQSALSRQVSLLEGSLGVQLFDRIGRRIELTSAGRDLLRRSRSVLNDIGAVEIRAKALAEGSGGLLRVGATPQTMESLVSKFLLSFKKRFPGVEFELVEDGALGLGQGVESGNLDVAIAGLTPELDLAGRPLFPLGALAIVPGNSRFIGQRTIEITELAQETLLLLKPQFMTRRIFDGMCQVTNISPRVLIDSNSPHCLLALVKARQGIAVVPSTVLLGALKRNAIPICHDGRPLAFIMSVVWDQRRYVSPAAELFVDELCAATKDDYPGKSFGFPEKEMTASHAD